LPSLLALTQSDFDPASRFRIMQWLPFLAAAGWDIAHRPNRPPRYRRRPAGDLAERLSFLGARSRRRLHRRLDIRAAAESDLVWLNRDMLEGDPRWEQRLLQANPRLVFDIDDAIYQTDRRGHFAAVCAGAALVIAGNETLAAEARRYARRVAVVPTVIDTAKYRAGAPERIPGEPLRLGWCGSDLSIRQTLLPALPMLANLQRRLGFRFTIMSRPRPELPSCGLIWDYVEWSPERETGLANWFDIGIMPLAEDPYLQAKCGCKLLQYMACGLPAIASPVGVNAAFLAASGAGLAATDPASWEAAIRHLADPNRRAELGRRGRAWCEAETSIDRWLATLDRLLREVAQSKL
jgi:glycosyltransferase involved in cell wall biosynthesis